MKEEITDALLWKELKKGSTIALGSIYDKYVDELLLFGCKIVADSDIVEDAIHDLFLDLYKYASNLSETTNVKFYLFSSLKNKILKNPQFKEQQYQTSFQLNREVFIEPTNSIEEIFIETEMRSEHTAKVFKALELLPKKQREGIRLKFIQNKTYEEIAEIMNVKVETCRTIVYRGVKSLRDLCMLFIGVLLSIW